MLNENNPSKQYTEAIKTLESLYFCFQTISAPTKEVRQEMKEQENMADQTELHKFSHAIQELSKFHQQIEKQKFTENEMKQYGKKILQPLRQIFYDKGGILYKRVKDYPDDGSKPLVILHVSASDKAECSQVIRFRSNLVHLKDAINAAEIAFNPYTHPDAYGSQDRIPLYQDQIPLNIDPMQGTHNQPKDKDKDKANSDPHRPFRIAVFALMVLGFMGAGGGLTANVAWPFVKNLAVFLGVNQLAVGFIIGAIVGVIVGVVAYLDPLGLYTKDNISRDDDHNTLNINRTNTTANPPPESKNEIRIITDPNKKMKADKTSRTSLKYGRGTEKD